MNCATNGDRVKPTATTRTSGDRTKFVPFTANFCANFIEQFRRERAATHAGTVGFDDTQHIIQITWTETGTGSTATGSGVGAGHIRIGTVVNIQHGALCAFE